MDMDAMVTDSHQLMMSEEQRHHLFKVRQESLVFPFTLHWLQGSWSTPHSLRCVWGFLHPGGLCYCQEGCFSVQINRKPDSKILTFQLDMLSWQVLDCCVPLGSGANVPPRYWIYNVDTAQGHKTLSTFWINLFPLFKHLKCWQQKDVNKDRNR